MSSIKKSLCSATARRGIISIIVFTVVWEICTRLHVPIIGNVPAPSSVIGSMGKQLTEAFYWISWRDSMMRIVGGFVLARSSASLWACSSGPARRRTTSSIRCSKSCARFRRWRGFRSRSSSGPPLK